MPGSSAPDSLAGRTLAGRYELLEALAEGTLFASYRSRDTQQGRVVAVKTLLPLHADNDELIQAVKAGFGDVTTLNYPGIARPLDIGSDEKNGVVLYLVEEFVRGIDLKERMRRGSPFAHTVAVDVAIAVADALAYAATRNVAHGDLRPEHVLTSSDAPIKVAAWGVAAAQMVAVTENPELWKPAAPYTAPEYWATGTPSASADLYALGMILFEMLIGSLPFVAEHPLQIARRHSEEPVPSPRAVNSTMPRALDGVTQRLLAKRPADRYESATALLVDLRLIRDALRFGKSLAWSPLDTPLPPPRPASMASSGAAIFDAAGTAVMPTGLSPAKRAPAPPPEPEPEPLEPVVFDEPAREPEAVEDLRELPPTIIAPARAREVPVVEEEIEPDDLDFDDSEEYELLPNAMPARRGPSFSWLLPLNLFLAIVLVAEIWYVGKVTFSALEPPADVVVPQLVGKSMTDAKTLAVERKFEIDVVSDEFNDKFPEDTIYQMSPAEGRHIRENKKVEVWVSKGPRMVIVPDVRDVAYDKARQQLEDKGLRVGDKTFDWSPLTAKGNVVDQTPESGLNLPRGTRVNLTLSKGPEPAPDETTTPVIDISPSPEPSSSPDQPDPEDKPYSLKVIYDTQDDGHAHNIRIDVTDRDGTRTPYEQTHKSGEKVIADVDCAGKSITIRLYDNDLEVREITGPPFQAQEKKPK